MRHPWTKAERSSARGTSSHNAALTRSQYGAERREQMTAADWVLTGGNRHDVTQLFPLLNELIC